MCGRKTLTRDIQSIIEEMAIEEWQDQDLFSPSYNIAPTQFSPIMVDHMGRRVKPMKWGLIPNWAKDKSIGSKLINARSETLLQKPSFQNLVSGKRCVVLTDGYYEWKRTSSKSIPYYIHHPENKLLPLAGLWDIWKDESDKSIFSYTVITTTPAQEIELKNIDAALDDLYKNLSQFEEFEHTSHGWVWLYRQTNPSLE